MRKHIFIWISVGVTIVVVIGGYFAFKVNQKASPLPGKWVLVKPEDLVGSDEVPEYRPIWDLTLRADGTYNEHREIKLMGYVIWDAKGSYRRAGNKLHFSGTILWASDDGYSKTTDLEADSRILTIDGNTLTDTEDPEMVYAKSH